MIYGIGYKDSGCTGACVYNTLKTLEGRGIGGEELYAVAHGGNIVNSDGAEGPGLYLVANGKATLIKNASDPTCGALCSLGYASTKVLDCDSEAGCVVAAASNVNPFGRVCRAVRFASKLKGAEAAIERTAPRNLAEKLALDEAKGGAGKRIMQGKINDPAYPENIWAKMHYSHENPGGSKTVIHYWENLQTGEREGFKFK